MTNLNDVAQTNAGQKVREYVEEWKEQVKDVSKELPINCENELAVRKNLVELIEKGIESELTVRDDDNKSKPTSYE